MRKRKNELPKLELDITPPRSQGFTKLPYGPGQPKNAVPLREALKEVDDLSRVTGMPTADSASFAMAQMRRRARLRRRMTDVGDSKQFVFADTSGEIEDGAEDTALWRTIDQLLSELERKKGKGRLSKPKSVGLLEFLVMHAH
jgi:hypothetical protein